MKNILLALCILAVSCRGTKKTAENSVEHSSAGHEIVVADTVPDCVKGMINGFLKEEKQNPPRKIYSYTYRGNTVYYVTPPCCDFYSDLYNNACQLLGHPDGGITGKGDGKMTDFHTAKTNEKLIWEDKRK